MMTCHFNYVKVFYSSPTQTNVSPVQYSLT